MGRLIGIVLIAGLILAILRAVLIALLVAFGLVLLWGFLSKPAETFGLLLFGAWLTLMQNYALLGLAVLAFAVHLSMRQRKDAAAAHPQNVHAPSLPTPLAGEAIGNDETEQGR